MKKRSVMRACASWLALTCAAAAANEIPKVYPTLDPGTSRSLIVVAQLEAGGYFPKVDECGKIEPNRVTICMNPPPFWIQAKILSTVHGADAPATLYAVTGSHYGMPDYGSTPYLAALATDGKDFEMLRYANRPLSSNKQGDLYLMIRNATPLYWLPCGVAALREEVDAADFPGLAAIAPHGAGSQDVELHPELFRSTSEGAVPRYALSVKRLRDYLAANPAETASMRCDTQPARAVK